MIQPEISHEKYHLQVKKKNHKGDGYHWMPVGNWEHTSEMVKEWLRADFNIFKEQPNIEYRITKVTYFQNVTEIIEVGNRD